MIREYGKRICICIASLALFGLGSFIGVKAGSAGTNAWNTLSLGMQDQLGISFGTATLLVSGLIIVIDLLGKGKVGIGSILNVLLIPFFSDLFLNLFAFVPPGGKPAPWSGAVSGGTDGGVLCHGLLYASGYGLRPPGHPDDPHRQTVSQGAHRNLQVRH